MNRKIGLLTLRHWFTVNCQQQWHEIKWQQICWYDKKSATSNNANLIHINCQPPSQCHPNYVHFINDKLSIYLLLMHPTVILNEQQQQQQHKRWRQQQQQQIVLLHVSDAWKMYEGLLFLHIKGSFHLVIETRWQCCSHNVSTKNYSWLSISFRM
jgi:hypothetical protein